MIGPTSMSQGTDCFFGFVFFLFGGLKTYSYWLLWECEITEVLWEGDVVEIVQKESSVVCVKEVMAEVLGGLGICSICVLDSGRF